MDPEAQRVLLVEGRFYEDIAESLVAGATAVLESAGFIVERVQVPGVYEIPAAMRFAIRAMEFGTARHRYAGFVSLGCVIRGETDHYEHICRESSRALMDLTINHTIAHGFGVLTCENMDQARVRADVGGRNIGGRAAHACLAMMALKKDMRLRTP
jgi:6,7-dimethyl-8-ribityllumazine synthase